VWKGGYRPYDLVKEASIALGVVLALAVVLAILFSSPDERSSTIKSWSRSDPVDFVTTAVSELDGTSGLAGYGPPYNHNDPGQHIAFIHLQKWFGVNIAIDPAQDFVLAPLRSSTASRPEQRDHHLSACHRHTADGVDNGVHQRPGQGQGRGRRLGLGAHRQRRPGPDSDEFPAGLRPIRRARRCPAHQQAVLRDRLHQGAAVHGRRRGPDEPCPGREPARRAVGHDERDRQLPGAGVALALHLLVPDQAFST